MPQLLSPKQQTPITIVDPLNVQYRKVLDHPGFGFQGCQRVGGWVTVLQTGTSKVVQLSYYKHTSPKVMIDH